MFEMMNWMQNICMSRVYEYEYIKIYDKSWIWPRFAWKFYNFNENWLVFVRPAAPSWHSKNEGIIKSLMKRIACVDTCLSFSFWQTKMENNNDKWTRANKLISQNISSAHQPFTVDGRLSRGKLNCIVYSE